MTGIAAAERARQLLSPLFSSTGWSIKVHGSHVDQRTSLLHTKTGRQVRTVFIVKCRYSLFRFVFFAHTERVLPGGGVSSTVSKLKQCLSTSFTLSTTTARPKIFSVSLLSASRQFVWVILIFGGLSVSVCWFLCQYLAGLPHPMNVAVVGHALGGSVLKFLVS